MSRVDLGIALSAIGIVFVALVAVLVDETRRAGKKREDREQDALNAVNREIQKRDRAVRRAYLQD